MNRSDEFSLPGLQAWVAEHLCGSVIPFWMTHAIDPAGGINTCIGDDGTLVNRDKWLWSQWRAVWVFSKLYNCVEPRPEWLEVAQGIYRFASRHGWDKSADGWVLLLDGAGNVLRGAESIYVDAFAIYGLTELAKATSDPEVIGLARQTADSVLARLQRTAPDQIPHFPYPIPPGTRVHGVPMMFSLVFWELGQHLDDRAYCNAASDMSDDIFENFYRRDRDLLLERLALDNSEAPPPAGTAVIPGHVIEDMWFQIHIARDRGDAARVAEAIRLIRRHLELGWDEKFGGILLAVDADGRDEVGWEYADTKIWWPHTEALYALLLAYEQSGEDWCLEWFRRVLDYSRAHYPVAGHGEWRQKLQRDGTPLTATVALPVKDPFHLPRSLIYCLDVLKRLV